MHPRSMRLGDTIEVDGPCRLVYGGKTRKDNKLYYVFDIKNE